MLRVFIIILLVIAHLLLPLSGTTARADGLTVATYIELTLARLRLARDSWEQKRAPLDQPEQQALFQRYNTTAAGYLSFGSVHRREIDEYLTGHPEENANIQALSHRIGELIEQREEP